MGPVRQALQDAGLNPSDISKVLLVGGSSRIPAVQEAVKKFMGKEPFKTLDRVLSALPSARLSRPVCSAARSRACCWLT